LIEEEADRKYEGLFNILVDALLKRDTHRWSDGFNGGFDNILSKGLTKGLEDH